MLSVFQNSFNIKDPSIMPSNSAYVASLLVLLDLNGGGGLGFILELALPFVSGSLCVFFLHMQHLFIVYVCVHFSS